MSAIPTTPTAAAAEDRFSALLDAAVDAIVVIGSEGRITRFNGTAERLFGYRAEEVLGRNVSMLMPASYRAEHDGYIQSYLRTGERKVIGIGREVIARRKDGSTFPIDLSVGEFRSGDEHGFVGILRDITARKRQEDQLHRSSEELRLVFENAPTAILITDMDGHVIKVNRGCCALLGYSGEELQGMRHSDLFHADEREAGVVELQRLQKGAETLSREQRYLRKDGSMLHALHYSSVARDAAGEPQLIIAEIVDRSALSKAMREAEDLRARLAHVARLGTLGEMVSGIAHEVNQPLTAITTYASACRRMVANGQADAPALTATFEKISAQAEHAGQVIRGLRNLVKRRNPVREWQDCNRLVDAVLRLTEFELRQSGFRLLTRLAPELPPVFCDGVQIQQVVLNLIRNGLEAMMIKAHGDVLDVTTCAPAPGWVEIHVADSGPGIEPATAARLLEYQYEPFFTTKPQGIGLGLSICQSIVRTHGGEMSFAANDYGGTTFCVRLPTTESGAAA